MVTLHCSTMKLQLHCEPSAGSEKPYNKSRNIKFYAMLSPITLPEMTLDKRTIAEQLEDAYEFFFASDLPPVLSAPEGDDPYVHSSGFIGFIAGTVAGSDPEVADELADLKRYLVAVAAIVTDYVHRYAAKYGHVFRTDPELWALAIAKIPLMGPAQVDTRTYARYIQGVDIAEDLVRYVLDIQPDIQQGGVLARFRRFVSRQGDTLRAAVAQNRYGYGTMLLGMGVEMIQENGQRTYIPRIKQFRVNFDRANTQWTAACGINEYADIHLNHMYAESILDHEALEDMPTRNAFEDFLGRARKAGIAEAGTYFNENF